MSVHLSPCFRDVQPGDVVTVGECRYGGYYFKFIQFPFYCMLVCPCHWRLDSSLPTQHAPSNFIIFQASVKDSQVQHSEGSKGSSLKEIFRQVLNCDD